MLVKPPSGHPLDSPAKRAAPSTRHALRQGRYKSLIVEEGGYLGGPLLHYTHLNPMRAGMTDVKGLRDYRWSSYWYLNHPAKRPVFMDCSGALVAAGGLADTSYGRGKYADYLNWLTSDRAAQDEMAFDKMCRGWALGTKDFKKALIAEAADASEGEDKPTKKVPRYDEATLQEANELLWEASDRTMHGSTREVPY